MGAPITQLQKQVAGLKDWTGLALLFEQDRLEEVARKKLEQALSRLKFHFVIKTLFK